MRSIGAGVALCAVMMLAGCGSSAEDGAASTTDAGTTPPSSLPPVSTTTAPPAPTLLPATAGADLLLKRSELSEIISATDLAETQAYTGPQKSNVKIDPYACRSRALVGETGVQVNEPTLVGNANRGANGQAVTQMVGIYENPRDIADQNGAMWLIENAWRTCPDGDIFFIELDPTNNQRWVPYPITTAPDRIGTTFQRDGLPRNCHHVVAHRANVLAEVLVCGDGDNTGPANTVADRILAKVPA